jgi:hypothetical protein
MKKRLLFIVIILLSGCFDYPTKNILMNIASKNDPEKLKLAEGYNKYIQRAYLKDGTELGIIYLKDGSSSKYWFRSHHLSKDIGGTWLFMSDGEKEYMAGWFCCEVQLPEQQIESLSALRKFIRKYDGISP